MRRCNTFYVVLSLFCFLGTAVHADPLSDTIYGKVQTFFAGLLKTDVQSVDIKLGRISEVFLKDASIGEIRVSSQRTTPRLGKQTIWLERYLDNALQHKVPVSVDVAVIMKVCVATQKMNRHDRLTDGMVELQEQRVDGDWTDIITSPEEIVGLETIRMIRQGTVLTKAYLRIPPQIRINDPVKVEIKSDALVITTDGVAKEEGSEGDRISVLCEVTGKRLTGVVIGPSLVRIEQESYQ